jgi:hypothetical protein
VFVLKMSKNRTHHIFFQDAILNYSSFCDNIWRMGGTSDGLLMFFNFSIGMLYEIELSMIYT